MIFLEVLFLTFILICWEVRDLKKSYFEIIDEKKVPFSIFKSDLKEVDQNISYLLMVNQSVCQKLNLTPIDLFVSHKKSFNAYANCLFGLKNVIFDSALVHSMPKDALGAVLCHELYHIKYRHQEIKLFLEHSFIWLINIFFISASYFVPAEIWQLPLLLIAPIVYFLTLNSAQKLIKSLINPLTRQMERRADLFAAQQMGVNAYKGAMHCFSNNSNYQYEDQTLKSFFKETHPSFRDRISYATKRVLSSNSRD